jgi:acyl-coenzyme A thioesterase PaaI-like protein
MFGRVLCPAFAVDRLDAVSLDGRVMSGPYFHGADDAVHGGAVALLFDEILGLPANINVTTLARTDCLHVNYRAITPIGKELQLTARVTSVQGRTRFVHGELKDGDIVCADAEGLLLELFAGQQ